MFVPSIYQEKIFDWFKDPSGPIAVNAKAGSGKTTTLVQGMLRMTRPGNRLFAAFNSAIVAELKKKLPPSVNCQTIHSLGLQTLRSGFPNIKKWDIENGNIKYRQMARDIQVPSEYGDKRVVQDAILSLLNYAQLTLTPLEVEDLIEMADRFGVEIPAECPIDGIAQIVVNMLEQGRELAEKGVISFSDMLYMPAVMGLTPPKYSLVAVDECLPYKTPVHLADGTSLQIGEIVEKKLAVDVLAFDTKTGQQKVCKVTSWHKILNQKPLVKVTVHAYRQGLPKLRNFVVCTTDHKLFVDGQWIEAGKLQPGMTAQIETSAIKSQAYKITTTGRQTLSSEMTRKNGENSYKAKRDATAKMGGITVRGGNGKGITVPQQVLLNALGDDWQAEYAVATGKRSEDYPTCYKLDIANPARKIAIEVDGASHNNHNRRAQDKKKEEFLIADGWRVFRFRNADAVQRPDYCIQQINHHCENGVDCPLPAKVISVEPMSIPDYHVYDITVEDCHNFYANGILVHNCQDLSKVQMALIERAVDRGGNFAACGDPRQAIYGFAGAEHDSFYQLKDHFSAEEMPLNFCYRCSESVIKEAQKIVPDIECPEGTAPGIVDTITDEKFKEMLKPGDMVLCRLTAPLVKLCFELIKRRIPAKVRGRDIGAQIANVVRQIMKRNTDMSAFCRLMYDWQEKQIAVLLNKLGSEDQQQSVNDKVDCLAICYAMFSPHSVEGFCADIKNLFSDDQSPITLCTVHRAKGLENPRVFIIKPEKLPLVRKNQTNAQFIQEMNLRYVAITRAQEELYFVESAPEDNQMMLNPDIKSSM